MSNLNNLIKTDTQKLQNEFLRGLNVFSRNQKDQSGAAKILKTIDLGVTEGDTITDDQYMDVVAKAKKILDTGVTKSFRDIYIVNNKNYVRGESLSNGELAMMIRLINMAHKHVLFIIYNDDLVFSSATEVLTNPALVDEHLNNQFRAIGNDGSYLDRAKAFLQRQGKVIADTIVRTKRELSIVTA